MSKTQKVTEQEFAEAFKRLAIEVGGLDHRKGCVMPENPTTQKIISNLVWVAIQWERDRSRKRPDKAASYAAAAIHSLAATAMDVGIRLGIHIGMARPRVH